MFSVVSGYLWGEGREEVEEVGVQREEDWVLLDKPEEELLYASSVAHMVYGKLPSFSSSLLGHFIDRNPMGEIVQIHSNHPRSAISWPLLSDPLSLLSLN